MGKLAAMTLALMLAACGQKGPLYLPDKGGQVVTSPPAASGTPSAPSAPTQPPAGTPGQPAQSAPAEAPPATTPPKKNDKDSDSQTQTPQ